MQQVMDSFDSSAAYQSVAKPLELSGSHRPVYRLLTSKKRSCGKSRGCPK
jgi:hypothetical protein